jgi:two-component system chemotaxis response regulator CheB
VAAGHGEPVRAGRIHVAPPDRHLLVENGHVVLSRGPKENGHRPAVDPLFRSLALDAGPDAVGVVLSGMLDDGAAGLLEIVRHGGSAVVQEPQDATYDGMPSSALEEVPGAVVRPAAAIGTALGQLLDRVQLGGHRPSEQLLYEVAASRGGDVLADRDPPGEPAALSCPDCAGPLFDVGSPGHRRYRCRVGHAWSPGSLGAAQDDVVEQALYAALRALEDKATLQRRIAESAQTAGQTGVAGRAERTAEAARDSATVLRRWLVDGHGGARVRDS